MKKEDRRVQRTRKQLHLALLSLIKEKGFEALSVQEIIDRANVGRATFYTHFDNKEDLLVSGFDGLRSALKEEQRKAHARKGGTDERLFAFSRETFVHVAQYRDVFRAMLGKQSGALVQFLLYKIIVDLVREDVKVLARQANDWPAETVVQFLAGGLFGIIKAWAEGRPRVSADEINTLFRKLAFPCISAVTRPL